MLPPRASRARKHPRGPITIVTGPSHDGGIPVTGKRDGNALVGAAYRVCADQFSLLAELRLCQRRQQAARQNDNRQNGKDPVSGSASVGLNDHG